MAAENKTSRFLNILIWCSVIPTFLGTFFKVMHWPFASVLIILGTFIIAFLYLPSWVWISWPDSLKRRVVCFFQAFVLWMFAMGFLFKMQHWPWAGTFFYINNFLLFFIVAPYAFYSIFKAGKKNIVSANSLFLAVHFFCFATSALMLSGSGKINIDAVVLQGVQSEKAYKAALSRNTQLYRTLEATAGTDKNSQTLQKAHTLKEQINKAVKQIQEIKSALIITADKIPKSVADTVSSMQIENKVNFDVPTWILIGNNEFL
jgi:hypothetical protein